MDLLAQLQTPLLPDTITNWIGTFGTIGFVVWYGYHVTAVTIPKINSDNNALVLRIVVDFKEEMRLERESHNRQLIAQRDECRRESGQLMAAFQMQIKGMATPPSRSDSQIIKSGDSVIEGT